MNPVPSAHIETLIRQFALSLEQAIRQEVDFRLKDELRRMHIDGAAAPMARHAAPAPAAGSDARPRRLCTTQGCPNPAAGPKYGWKCREHGAEYRAARAAGRPPPAAPKPAPVVVSLPAPRVATVIPQTVSITRLPPGPTPHDPKRPGPPMECRLPGCMLKSRGPRYDFFCADHYQQLSADQRRYYAELWRQSRAGGRS